jgi:hypothetical protein
MAVITHTAMFSELAKSGQTYVVANFVSETSGWLVGLSIAQNKPQTAKMNYQQANTAKGNKEMKRSICIYLTDDEYMLIHRKQVDLTDSEYGKKSISSIARAILLRKLREEGNA